MIIKSFELNKINVKSSNFYLFYGENEGYKNEAIEKIIFFFSEFTIKTNLF